MRLVVYTMHGVRNLHQAAAILNHTGAVRALVQVELGFDDASLTSRADALLRFEDYPAYCYFCEKTNQTPMTTTEYFA